MKRHSHRSILGLALFAAMAVPCAASASAERLHSPMVSDLVEGATEEVRVLLGQPTFSRAALGHLSSDADGQVALSTLLAEFDPGSTSRAASVLAELDGRVRALKGLPQQGAPLLSARVVLPRGMRLEDVDASSLRVAAAPMGDDRQWKTVTARAADGSSTTLDAQGEVTVPVLVVGVDTRQALAEGMALVNAGLRERGLQSADSTEPGEALELTRLDHIRLAYDQEPNIKGAAEVFAIESGIQVSADKPEMRTFEMPWLDHDKTDYYPNQELVVWNKYRFGVANLQLFEEDGNTNYKVMLQGLLQAVTTIVGPIEPTVAVVGSIADAVLKVMPDSWFTDDHDYIDSFYLVQRGKTYRNLQGAGGNAMVSLSPMVVTR